MSITKCEILSMKKLKKGGTLNSDINWKVIRSLSSGEIIAMPMDFFFGYVGASDTRAEVKIKALSGKNNENIIRVVSSFKMLEKTAVIDKLRFDFLHRVWPGDVIVKLKKQASFGSKNNTIFVLIPKNKFILEIVETLRRPLLFVKGFNTGRLINDRNKVLIRRYKRNVGLILIIDELCRDYPSPTILDLSEKNLNIIQEGKVSSDEIKSLYFLNNVK